MLKNLLTATIITIAGLTCQPGLKAELVFHYDTFAYSPPGTYSNLAKDGQFFASSDYDVKVKIKGPVALFQAKNVTGPGQFPNFMKPWTNGGEDTVFGVKFNYPLPSAEKNKDGDIPLCDRAVIHWGRNVPAPGAWAACITTAGGGIIKLKAETEKKIYPYDRTTIYFEPMAVKSFNVGLKKEAGGIPNYADVLGIDVCAAEKNILTNSVAVWQPDFYAAAFSKSSPGTITGIAPVNSFCMSNNQASFYDKNHFDIFSLITPFIDFKGKKIFPSNRETPFTAKAENGSDILTYKLLFALPGKNIEANAAAEFRKSPADAVKLSVSADKLPDGAKLGWQFLGFSKIFGKYEGSVVNGPMSTPAGEVKISSDGKIKVFKETDKNIDGGWMPSEDKVRFEALSTKPKITVSFSLPIGEAGAPQPETLNYTWRPSLAGSGDLGIKPFSLSDLELLEEIDCGNPGDPHKLYDSSNDPVIDAERKKHGKLISSPWSHKSYGYLTFADNPEDGAVPVETIAGQKCLAIPDREGAYFRYNLNVRLKNRTPYLIAVEHAFDRLRRGEFHSVLLDEKNNIANAMPGGTLFGGFETGGRPENKFKTESVLCYFPLPLPNRDCVNSIVFSNIWRVGGFYEKTPGLAVRSIKIYRVKTMPELPDIAGILPVYESQRSLTILTEEPNPWMLFQWPRLVGYNGLWTYCYAPAGFLGGHYRINRNQGGAAVMHPGTLEGNKMLFEAAEKQGVFLNMHLGQLLRLAFADSDYDSFTEGMHHSYCGEYIPFKPSKDELEHIAGAVKKALPVLAKYKSLRDIALADNPQWPNVWSARNIEDFNAATGEKLAVSPFYLENAHTILQGGAALVKKWSQWACGERFKFHKWLLDELKKYRSDLYITLSRNWYWGLVSRFESAEPVWGATRERLAALGIKDYDDYLRFMGTDPELYKGNPGVSLELEAGAELRNGVKDVQIIPDYYQKDWFKRIKSCFSAGGLSIMRNYCYDECSKPLSVWTVNFFANQEKYRRGLIEALLYANARNITLPTYEEPWRSRIEDLREFAVPYRLLPFAQPEPFAGKITDSASQAVINKYGNRYGLINAGPKETVAELELPSGKTSVTVTDLSNGVPQKLDAKNGRAKIALAPWSLKTLEIQEGAP